MSRFCLAIVVILIIITRTHAGSDHCTVASRVGQQSVANAADHLPSALDTDATILMANPHGTVTCCGYVTAWDAYVKGHGHLRLQVWRPIPGRPGMYTLLGENGFQAKTNVMQKHSFNVPPKNWIFVDTGDVVAIKQIDSAVALYTECDPRSPVNKTICAYDNLITYDVIPNEAGFEHRFATSQSSHLNVSTVRAYAITARLNKKVPPSCDDKSHTITDLLEIGALVTDVNIYNVDLFHSNHAVTIDTTSPSIPLEIDDIGELIVVGELNADYPHTVYEVTIRVKDSCASTDTCVVTLTVTNEPKPIRFLGLPASISLVPSGDVIHKFQITRQRVVDDVTCYINDVIPEVDYFEVTASSRAEYVVRLKGSKDMTSLSEELDSVTMEISCNNSEGFNNEARLTFSFKEIPVKGMSFWILAGVLGSVLLIAVIIVLLTALHHKGIVRLWPLSNDDQIRESSVSTISHNTNDVMRAKNHHGNGIVPLEATNIALSFASSTPSYRFWNAPMVKSPRPVMASSSASCGSTTRTDPLNTSDVASKASQVKHVKKRPWFP